MIGYIIMAVILLFNICLAIVLFWEDRRYVDIVNKNKDKDEKDEWGIM